MNAVNRSGTTKPGQVPAAASLSLGILSLLELILAGFVVLQCIEILAADAASRPKFVLFSFSRQLSTDTLIIVLAIAAGVVGSFISSATSYVKYFGNRKLRSWWIPWYLVRAPIGAALAVILYLLFRAGLLPTTSASKEISPLGVAALSGLAGMFSNRAVEKLEDIFNAAFGEHPSGDALKAEGPTITSVTWSDDGQRLVADGSNFDEDVTVVVDNTVIPEAALEPDRVTIERAQYNNLPAAVGPRKLRIIGSRGSSNVVNLPDPPS
jgi:uncharacterized membrane protein YeaQ/YmgE (transglycosylase-associated protein family)